MIFEEDDYLAHYGTPRHSGRYPWGSGGNATARDRDFLGQIAELRKQGVKDVDIAKGFGISTTQLRAQQTIAKTAERQDKINQAYRLREKGMGYVAIGKQMGIPESSVRALLAPSQKLRTDVLAATSNILRDAVDEKTYIQIGVGVEYQLGISKEKLAAAVAILQEEGYRVHNVQIPQLGTNTKTTIKVLAPPGTEGRDVNANKDKIQLIQSYSNDGGQSYSKRQPPIDVDSKRLAINYKETGGALADGVIYVRPGVEDLSLGKARYAQVRISIEGTHYVKGMAMYKDDLPAGVDIMFNTNKSNTGNKLDALKPMYETSADNPFGAMVRQLPKLDSYGNPINNTVRSAMNIVNEEGDWDKWSKTLASQMLSKQSRTLAKTQLDMAYESKQAELEGIMKLTNPAVRKKLLLAYSEDADAAAVHLKAAHLPRQRTQVILPIPSMKETEVYAPNFENGERVALIRYPHGGIFEIPELVVNNNHRVAKSTLGRAEDAIGIHPKVAERLSGADFDGDTVLVIPNNSRKIKSAPTLKGLVGFDAKAAYPYREGMKVMDERGTQYHMGMISNLITDMTIRGAVDDELARAVRHSMVVIDAKKHKLDWQQSAINNGIDSLAKKYQDKGPGRRSGGASTVVSNSGTNSTTPVLERKTWTANQSGAIDPVTGKKVFRETGASYVDPRTGKTVIRTSKVARLSTVDDAHAFSSGTKIEEIYADHSNRMKALGNEARRSYIRTRPVPMSPSAKMAYGKEVDSLNRSLRIALENAPRERQAQLVANVTYSALLRDNPDMDATQRKRERGRVLEEARNRLGAKKTLVPISPAEWAAIQAGAVSNHKLEQILDNTDLDVVKEYATPRTALKMTAAKTSRARQMIAQGYTQSDVASALGVSLTTLKTTLAE